MKASKDTLVLVSHLVVVSLAAARLLLDENVQSLATEGLFWFVLLLTAFNPLSLVADRPCLVVTLLLFGWLGVALVVAHYGSPMILVELFWRAMTRRSSLFIIAVLGSAVFHVSLTAVLNLWPMIMQNIPRLQKYKIQETKKPPSAHEWSHVFIHIAASQLLVQLPLITGQYYFMKYFDIPYDFDSMPRFADVAWRLALSLVIDDTWVYFGHRALHHRSIYKYIHKVHHTYTSPFAPDAEYEHPVETVVLGTGFFLACMCFTNHLVTMWAWLYVRLLVTYDSHSGYDLPLSLFHLMPFYNGAREHDWHHQYFNGNYAPTFTYWDEFFNTNAQFKVHEQKRLAREGARNLAREEAEAKCPAEVAQAEASNPRAEASMEETPPSLLPIFSPFS
mmetsp:Transcript_30132/g.54591  ORF Transcript_30132/g.54591 Transcript_30132/m.54591 type:complete len:391 (-) Transcript_30132:270-1442(-)